MAVGLWRVGVGSVRSVGGGQGSSVCCVLREIHKRNKLEFDNQYSLVQIYESVLFDIPDPYALDHRPIRPIERPSSVHLIPLKPAQKILPIRQHQPAHPLPIILPKLALILDPVIPQPIKIPTVEPRVQLHNLLIVEHALAM